MAKELNSSAFPGIEISAENCYFRSNGDDPNDPFESALSSMVSSPTSNGGGLISSDGMMIRELIGRLGSICESGEISPQSCIATANNTPLNSPPKFNLSPLNHHNFPNHPPSLAFFNGDPGFAERAAKFSSFGVGPEMGITNRSGSKVHIDGNSGVCDSREGSSVSEQNTVAELGGKSQNDVNSRKRKSIPKTKIKGEAAKNEGSNAKRSKKDEESNNNNSKDEENNSNVEKPEPPKDYIHVRARRGQATDSHSLAERVRREKISERMKFLQGLVPGCNKVTGKATVLDEIINYVQSLQRQVEFLSMKLATVNSRMDFNMEALLSKEILECRGSPQGMYPLEYQKSAQAFPYGCQSTQQMLPSFVNGIPNGSENPFSLNPLNATGIHRNPTLQSGSIAGFSDPMNELPYFWEDDLHSIVQMGTAQNQTQTGSRETKIQSALSNGQMKVEL